MVKIELLILKEVFKEATILPINFYRAHTKYDAKVMFSAFLSFC